jgi:hypothetical protein
MAIFQFNHMNSTSASFWNEDQSITGEVQARSCEFSNYIELDDEDIVLTDEMEEELMAVRFPEYHHS